MTAKNKVLLSIPMRYCETKVVTIKTHLLLYKTSQPDMFKMNQKDLQEFFYSQFSFGCGETHYGNVENLDVVLVAEDDEAKEYRLSATIIIHISGNNELTLKVS
jgi:hypothetical protein